MKRVLLAVAGLVILGIAVSLGGVVVDEVNRVFWTQSLIWTSLTTLVLAPILVFLSGAKRTTAGAESASGHAASSPSSHREPASYRTVEKQPASSQQSASQQSASFPSKDGGARTPSPTAPSSSPGAPAHGTHSHGAASHGAANQPAREDESARATGRARKRSLGRTLAYVFTGGLLLWLVTSLAGIFFDPANLAFWTQSLMWTLLATVLWGPALAFIVNPLKKRAPSAQKTEAFIPTSSTSPPAVVTARTDGSELERNLPASVPAEEHAEAPSPPNATAPPSARSTAFRTPSASPPIADDEEWPIWPDDEPSS